MALLALAGCMSRTPPASAEPVAAPLEVSIEQNGLGEYVFCLGDCPAWTQKTLSHTPRPPAVPKMALPKSDTIQVYFALASSKLSNSSKQQLSAHLPTLKQAKRIYLRGWADSIGGKDTRINRRLARERAGQIKQWLSRNGVTAAKISSTVDPACCNRDDTRAVVINWTN